MSEEIIVSEFYKFPSEEVGRQVLGDMFLIDSEGQFILSSHKHALDVLGTIVRGGKVDWDGTVIEPPEVLEGWHVNYRGYVSEQMKQYAVYPTEPYRVFL